MSTATLTNPGISTAATPAKPRGGFDWPLAAIVVVLASFGLLMILSASSLSADAMYGDAMHYVTRQLIGLALGSVAAGIVLSLSWSYFKKGAWALYLSTVLALCVVMSPFGHTAKGAARWIRLGPLNFQPSELAKLAAVLILAHYLSANQGRLRDVVGVGLPGLGLIAPLVALIVLQKDFGTTVILFGITGVLYFVAGLQWRYIFAGVLAAVTLLVGLVLIEPYRMKRLTSFVDPFMDPDGSGYQVVQGWIALAAGGPFGAGLATGVAQRGFLPEAHTDFIVAVIGEELGAVGWTFALLLLVGMVVRGFVIASRAVDTFGMLAAAGVTAMFAAQAIINVGVVGGMVPPKGLVLPFLSYGASAAMVHALCVGVLLRISMETSEPVASPAPRG